MSSSITPLPDSYSGDRGPIGVVYYEVINSRPLVLIGSVVNKIEPVKTLKITKKCKETCPDVYIFLSKSLGVFG